MTLSGCTAPLDCSLNGLCNAGKCVCDAPWTGDTCGKLSFAPGRAHAVFGKPLCAYHGADRSTTTWGGSVLRVPEEGGRLYMWVAEMVEHCDLGAWQTNSQIALATATDPLGAFERIDTVLPPWGHNPQAIRAPDAEHGSVYVLYALGDGVPINGPPVNCSAGEASEEQQLQQRRTPSADNGTITANFTVSWAASPRGPYERVVCQILDWPENWDYGAHGNWNPAPVVHPNGTIYLMDHTSSLGFMNGEAIIAADTWRGPYRIVASNTYPSWVGHVWRAEDPYMWLDARLNWHTLYNWGGGQGDAWGPGGHAFSQDGIRWSFIEFAFNCSRPVLQPNGSVGSVDYCSERPKLLHDVDGTPTHLYAGSHKNDAFTIVSPLGAAAPAG